jgi:hypothetical protein
VIGGKGALFGLPFWCAVFMPIDVFAADDELQI